ncbi:hypothetical protein [Bradyrhizobium sp. HKCCYLR20261]|uniref:hypothetical protein n=1 Tax=Bradyrhizobium sp. HKCCYLR20261 TaxID=3420760 RepID=UPI003EBE9258
MRLIVINGAVMRVDYSLFSRTSGAENRWIYRVFAGLPRYDLFLPTSAHVKKQTT